MKELLFNALRSKGFAAPAANDLSTGLEKVINRCDAQPTQKDVNDLIYALEQVKLTLPE